MLKLIKLEMKKFKIGGNIRAAVIANLIMLGFILLMGFTARYEADADALTYSVMMLIIESIVRDVFIIFAAVLIAEYVIGEYKNKTITVLFTYSINRKKLIGAKLIIIGVFTLACIILSDIFINLVFYAANNIWSFIPDVPTASMVYKQAVKAFVNALAAAGISFIPLYFGMIKKSTSAAIVAGVIVVALVGSSSNDFSLFSITIIPITLAVIGLASAYLSLRKINKTDAI